MAGLQDSLLPIFIEETEEGLSLIQNLILAENDVVISAEVLEEARRAAHTIKGTAGLVKRMRSSAVAKVLEEFLDGFNVSGDTLSTDDTEKVRQWHAQLVELLQYARDGQPEPELQDPSSEIESACPDGSSQGDDLINDFALPFMMKLHQANEELDETVKPVCCRFYLGGRQYFILIEDVVEISESQEITFLPYGPVYISGLISLRGDVIPVIDLAALEGRNNVFPNPYFLVVVRCGSDLMAFVSDSLPNLNVKTAGHRIDVSTFLEQHSVKAS